MAVALAGSEKVEEKKNVLFAFPFFRLSSLFYEGSHCDVFLCRSLSLALFSRLVNYNSSYLVFLSFLILLLSS